MTCNINFPVSALDKFMDAEYADKLTLSRAAKAEIILAGKYLPSADTPWADTPPPPRADNPPGQNPPGRPPPDSYWNAFFFSKISYLPSQYIETANTSLKLQIPVSHLFIYKVEVVKMFFFFKKCSDSFLKVLRCFF